MMAIRLLIITLIAVGAAFAMAECLKSDFEDQDEEVDE